jgi:hypothetical protein
MSKSVHAYPPVAGCRWAFTINQPPLTTDHSPFSLQIAARLTTIRVRKDARIQADEGRARGASTRNVKEGPIMSQVIEQESRDAPAGTDLTAAVQRVLAASEEPLTLSKIRVALPGSHRRIGLEELADALRRQVAANVLHQFPKYRSAQDRFWDRPMQVHVANLLRSVLEEGPLAWPQLRRKLPDYAVAQAEVVLQEQVAQGRLHRHPPAGSRSGERYGVTPPDAREYMRRELPALVHRLEQLGFTEPQLREAAMAVLQEEEWGQQESQRRPSSTAEPPRAEQPPNPEPSQQPASAPAGNVP